MTATVNLEDLVEGLKALGLAEGDAILVHSSLKSFGHVEGGAETVVKAALEVLGEEGTLAVPTFDNYFWDGPDQVWDREHTPSKMGIISETVRTWPGARRSRHAPHPISAVGKYALDLAERHNQTDFSFDSPFFRLIELNAWITFVGVEFNVCTMLHLVEERAQIRYRHWVELSGTVIEDGVAAQKTFPFYKRHPRVSNDFITCGRELEQLGKVSEVTIGQSTIKAVRARDLYEHALARVRQDPLFLVSADTREEAAKYLPKWGRVQAEQAEKKLPLHEPEHPIARRLAEKLYVTRAAELQAQTRKKWQTEDGLVLEELRLSGSVADFVPGLLAYPQEHSRPLPTMICLHGTGGTWHRMMEEPFVADGVVLRGWARELARRGYAALAITQFAHPPRREPWDWRWGATLPVYGQTAMGRLVSDVVLCVDYLLTRPEVDASRIAVSGFSLGGIASFCGFVVDERIAAACTFCGGVGSVAQLMRGETTGFHSAYFYPHGLLSDGLDHPQLVPTLAPRPLLVCGSTEDPGMPVKGVITFQEAAEREYAERDAQDRFRVLIESGPHAMTMAGFETMVGFLSETMGPGQT